MDNYVPAYSPPCESYWQTLLIEGPLSEGLAPGPWEWIEAPVVPLEVWDEARERQKHHTVIELVIDDYNRGGVITHWQGIECFVPASHLIDYPFPADPASRELCFQEYLGKKLRLCIIEVEPDRNRILLSERQVAECELTEPEWPDWLCIGTTCEGVVTSVRPFGAFVDIGPMEGMVHISEISWGRVRHPVDFLKPGQTIRVKILNVDFEHQRVGLSLKRLRENPWKEVGNHITPGEITTGTIVSIERFGLFIELMEGIEGLLHISELAHQTNGDDIHTLYHIGDIISVRILEIIAGDHRIGLGLAE
ncbi:MAG: S1 RNA-binding domain-containing protein [Anaerolineae bacterium]|nr:S1 RNA-binding domain-containing protein [Anaerolineae bacterium]